MTAMPKKSAQTEKTSPIISVQPEQVIEPEKSVQTRGVSPTMAANPTYSFEQKVSISSDSQPQITIDSESMQVDSTQVTVDKSEDPFKDFGPTIIGNIVSYSSS